MTKNRIWSPLLAVCLVSNSAIEYLRSFHRSENLNLGNYRAIYFDGIESNHKIKEIISTQLRYPTISTCKDVLKENLPLTNYRQLDYDVESINHK